MGINAQFWSELEFKYLNKKLLSKVFDFIESNYTQQISLKIVAKEVNYSPAYLTDLVRRQTGKTIISWVIERRLIQANILFSETNYTVEKVAYSVGYQNLNHFYKQYSKRFKISPGKYRKIHRL
jgi:AraC family transcriptional regulator